MTAIYHPNTQARQQLVRFLVVGATSTVVDFGLLALLKVVGTPTLIANTIAFSTGTLYNFALSLGWTYVGARPQSVGWQLALFVFFSLISLVLNDALVLALETPLGTVLGHAAWGYLPAKFLATGVVAVWSFITNRWIFVAPDGV